jgi:hypothetical protein
MEKFSASLSQFIDSAQLQKSIPEYLWFLIAIGGIVGALLILSKMVNYLISNLNELKRESAQHAEDISVIHETLRGIKEILFNYGNDIRELRNKKRGQ